MAALILIVITDGDLREGIRELLELEGYAILDTDMAVLGVQLAQEYLPNLVLCDVSLEGQADGFWLFNELYANQRTASIPCVLLTTYPLPNNEGMNSLTKPFTADELLVTVDACLQ
ncbi:MAG: response regulator [Anaerolineae bacterium]|jgi:CheY-like chemotaxis protein|nr:MAG: response regulator [Anaerolineae bacterium]MCL4878864.1 response regulator [Anaerolineae bacterium]